MRWRVTGCVTNRENPGASPLVLAPALFFALAFFFAGAFFALAFFFAGVAFFFAVAFFDAFELARAGAFDLAADGFGVRGALDAVGRVCS